MRRNSDSHRSTELDALRKPFLCKERILCDSCTSLLYMGGAALRWIREIAGEGEVLRGAENYFHSSWVIV